MRCWWSVVTTQVDSKWNSYKKCNFFFLYSLFFLQMSFHQMIWLKSSSLFLCLGPAVYVCTGPRLSLKIPGKLKTCCQSAFNAPRDNLECLHMPRRACGVGKVWHRQVLWLMHCLVCPWADSELKAWWEPYLHFFFFFFCYSLLYIWEMSALIEEIQVLALVLIGILRKTDCIYWLYGNHNSNIH